MWPALRHFLASLLSCLSRAVEEPGRDPATANEAQQDMHLERFTPVVFTVNINESPKPERAHPPLHRHHANSNLNLPVYPAHGSSPRYSTDV